MRDNRSPDHGTADSLDWYGRLAQEALGNLVAARSERQLMVRQDDLDSFLDLLAQPSADNPTTLLHKLLDRQVEPVAVANLYVPEAARCLGEQWLADTITFVDVTVRTERLHGVVRLVDQMMSADDDGKGKGFLILVAEGEQHTLGAFVLATQLRQSGFTAILRVAPSAAELTQLLASSRFAMALVSVGCETGLASATSLVRMVRLLSRDAIPVIIGGSIPMSDAALLAASDADSVGRDIGAILAGFGEAIDRIGLQTEAKSA